MPVPEPKSLRLAILNDSQPVLKMLCNWFESQGHECTSAIVAEMPRSYVQIETFISSVNPDVVVYDVAMPYLSSWDLLQAILRMPSMESRPFVVTTPNKKELDNAVGAKTPTLEIAGNPADLQRLLKAVTAASASPR